VVGALIRPAPCRCSGPIHPVRSPGRPAQKSRGYRAPRRTRASGSPLRLRVYVRPTRIRLHPPLYCTRYMASNTRCKHPRTDAARASTRGCSKRHAWHPARMPLPPPSALPIPVRLPAGSASATACDRDFIARPPAGGRLVVHFTNRKNAPSPFPHEADTAGGERGAIVVGPIATPQP
jgi:hypothetical protein